VKLLLLSNVHPKGKKDSSISLILGIMLLLCTLCVLLPRRYSRVGEIDLLSSLYYTFIVVFSLLILYGKIPARRSILEPVFSLTLLFFSIGMSYYRYAFGSVRDFSELWRSVFLSIIIIGCRLISTVRVSKEECKKYLKALTVIVTISMGISIIWSLSFNTTIENADNLRILSAGVGIVRATSPFGGPNLVGALGAIIFPLTLLFQGKLKYVPPIVVFVGTILTGSKTGILSLLCSLIIITLFFLPKKTVQSFLLVIVILGIGLFITVRYDLRIMDLLNPKLALQSGGSFRIRTWQEAIGLIAEKPIFGWGKDYLYYGRLYSQSFSAHNVWLQLFLDYGIFVGFVASMLLFSSICYIVYWGFKMKGSGLLIASSSISFFVSSFGDYIFWESRALIIMSLLFGAYLMLVNNGVDFIVKTVGGKNDANCGCS
jgi:O-antigen ligase